MLAGGIVAGLVAIVQADDLNFRGRYVPTLFTPVAFDLYGGTGRGDSWLDLLGARNDAEGTLTAVEPAETGLAAIFGNARAYRDARVADLNGDGLPDIIANTYSCYEDDASLALLFLNRGVVNGVPRFEEDPSFRRLNGGHGLRGHGETIVVADFDNDGDLDVFLPYYTFPYAPGGPCAQNAPQSYLLVNDGTGFFNDVAVAAGVALEDWPDLALRPEGAQAVDLDKDGFIDLYVASHLRVDLH